jgi:hypothetical protein
MPFGSLGSPKTPGMPFKLFETKAGTFGVTVLGSVLLNGRGA